jgi:hypothetical protein
MDMSCNRCGVALCAIAPSVLKLRRDISIIGSKPLELLSRSINTRKREPEGHAQVLQSAERCLRGTPLTSPQIVSALCLQEKAAPSSDYTLATTLLSVDLSSRSLAPAESLNSNTLALLPKRGYESHAEDSTLYMLCYSRLQNLQNELAGRYAGNEIPWPPLVHCWRNSKSGYSGWFPVK